MSRLPPLLLVTLARLALAQDWAVSAQVSHAPTGTADPRTGRPLLVQRFAVSCTPPPGVGAPRYSTDGIVTRFAAQPAVEYPVSGALGIVTAADSLSGELTTSTAVIGARVFPEMRVQCGSGLASPSTPLTVRGEVITTAPWVAPRLGVVPLDGADVGPDADRVPVGGLVRLLGFVESSPRGAERLVVRITGPGVDLTLPYGEADGDVTTAFNNDPRATFRAAAPGTLQVWAEFEGLRSEVRAVSVVGSAPVDPSPAETGCAAVPGVELLALLLLAARKGVRS